MIYEQKKQQRYIDYIRYYIDIASEYLNIHNLRYCVVPFNSWHVIHANIYI